MLVVMTIVIFRFCFDDARTGDGKSFPCHAGANVVFPDDACFAADHAVSDNNTGTMSIVLPVFIPNGHS
jgi:hypothetical protein